MCNDVNVILRKCVSCAWVCKLSQIARIMRQTWASPWYLWPGGPHVGPMNLAIRFHILTGDGHFHFQEPQCIEGYQESGKSHVVGAYSARRDLSLQGCKELCMSVEEGDECVAIDYK